MVDFLAFKTGDFQRFWRIWKVRFGHFWFRLKRRAVGVLSMFHEKSYLSVRLIMPCEVVWEFHVLWGLVIWRVFLF